MPPFNSIEGTLAQVQNLHEIYERYLENCEAGEKPASIPGYMKDAIRRLLPSQNYHRTRSFGTGKDSAKHERMAYLISLTIREYNAIQTFHNSNERAHLKVARTLHDVTTGTLANSITMRNKSQ